MRLGTGPSWQLRIHDLRQALVAALHVRDGLGLSVPGSPPPLVPTVPPTAPVPARSVLADEWGQWWHALLTMDDEDRLGPDPWLPSDELRTLRPLVDARRTESLRWAADLRRATHISPDGSLALRARSGPEPLLVTRLVAEMEREAGRPARPFVLRVDVLPVVGPWWMMPSPGHLLVGQEIYVDAHAWRSLLRELLAPVL
ncbi:hypothetical protein [Cellulomonas hominis]